MTAVFSELEDGPGALLLFLLKKLTMVENLIYRILAKQPFTDQVFPSDLGPYVRIDLRRYEIRLDRNC